jgi:hypothetical protein
MNEEKECLFMPQELKTIEVDVEKKIFKINGKEFGRDCTGFRVSCVPGEWTIKAEIDTTIHFTTYDGNGKIESNHSYVRNSSTIE